MVGDYLDPGAGIFRPGFVSASLDRSTALYFANPERPAIATIVLDDHYRGRGWAIEGDPILEEIELPEGIEADEVFSFEADEVLIWNGGVARVIRVEKLYR